jgi:hypothetical protein
MSVIDDLKTQVEYLDGVKDNSTIGRVIGTAGSLRELVKYIDFLEAALSSAHETILNERDTARTGLPPSGFTEDDWARMRLNSIAALEAELAEARDVILNERDTARTGLPPSGYTEEDWARMRLNSIAGRLTQWLDAHPERNANAPLP